MGNLMTMIANAAMEEIAKKVHSMGYHSYNIDFEKEFTIEGIRSNPKCNLVIKKASISADELFVLENISIESNVLKIGKSRFTCTDPEFSCDAAGLIHFTNVHLTLSVSVSMPLSGPQIDDITVKPIVTKIKSEVRLLFNKKDCSKVVNSVISSQDPTLLNFALELLIKSQEEPIRQFINTNLREAQRMQVFSFMLLFCGLKILALIGFEQPLAIKGS